MPKRSLSKMPPEQDDEESDEGEGMNFSDEEGGYRIEDIYIPPPPRPALTTEDIGPRLIIRKIVNRWFKSYAGTCVVGPFHKRFNAVIGPNGSGKSNVIDSMLFVFGYRASRIRSKKISALIHNSEKYQNVQSCTVAVHFAQITDKAGDDYDILLGSEFIVSRTANKDNSSYYELDGRRVQFKEVALLLRKHGIDLDNNRFLILQGEVEQISLMKAKAETEHETGMLEYLEDIVGTARYKEPLERLTERCRVLSDKRNDKLNRCKLVENEMEKLKEPMEKAVGYLKLENDITSAKNILIQIEIHSTEEELANKNYEKEGIELEVNQVLDKLKELQSEQNAKKKHYNQVSKEYATLESTKDKCKLAFEKLNNKDVELQAEMEETNKNRKKLKKQLETEQKKKAELTNLPAKAEKSINEYQAKEGELVKKLEKLEGEKQEVLASLKDCTKELQERREVLQEDLLQLRSKVDEAKSSFTIAESELNLYTSNADNEQKKLDTLKATYENVKRTVIERKRDIDGLKQEIPAAERRLEAASKEFEKLTTRQYELTAQRRDKMAAVESSRSAMQSSRSRGKVLDSLTQQKREGRCPGLFGRLGDLGAIDQKYDIAVSTACGALDHIVVDTVDTAEWCIEFLKKYDIGRASFIALDKQEHFRGAANSTIQTPENVPRLYDLVRVADERVKTAFYFALRDTLVAQNLDQASRIAYGGKRGNRVVTLAGDLIETSGTMSGGGRQVIRGRMGQSVAVTDVQPQEIETMEKELRTIEAEFNANRERLTALNQEMNELKPKLKEMKQNINKHTIELDSLKIQEPALLKQLNEQTKKTKEIKLDPNEVKRLTQTVEKFKEGFQKAQDNAASFQVKVDAITKEINDKTSGRVQAVDKKIKDITKNLDAVRAQITKDKVSVSTVARNLEKCIEKLATLERDIADSEERLLTMKTQRDEIDTDGAQIMKHLEGLAHQMEEKEEELDELKQAVNALGKKENDIKGSKIEVDEKFKKISKEINQLQATILAHRSDLTKLKYHEMMDQPPQELKTYTAEELAEKNVEALKNEVTSSRKALQQQQPNFAAIEEYKRGHAEYMDKMAELKAVTEQRNKIGAAFDSLKNRRKTEFLTAFRIIRLKLREMYQMITLGGDADLELIDSYDPFTEGVKLNVRPPKKPWKNITNLSGGEKTLSSLALVFALHYYKPSPLYVMDEIDAALDFKNVSIVAHYIKERTKNTQFVIISLRPNMFELANYLIGICKVQDCTSALTLDVLACEKEVMERHQYNTINGNKENGDTEMERDRDNQERPVVCNSQDLESILNTSQSTIHSGVDTIVPDSFSEREDIEEMDAST